MSAAELRAHVLRANETVTEGQAAANAAREKLTEWVAAIRQGLDDTKEMISLSHEKFDEASRQYGGISANEMIVQASVLSHEGADRLNELVAGLESVVESVESAIGATDHATDEIIGYGSQAIEYGENYMAML